MFVLEKDQLVLWPLFTRLFVSPALLSMHFLSFVCLLGAVVATVIDLGYAKYSGKLTPNGDLEQFGPIRFAAKPKRWALPTEPASETGAAHEQGPGPSCHNFKPKAHPGSPPNVYAPGSGTEDCLFLAVYKPAGDVSGLPVVFHIHGGGYQEGEDRHKT